MRIAAFIFARGNSKGLPGKNIRLLGGVPLIGHSIKLAAAMPAIDRVFVSTDSKEIAEIAQQFGAEVIERPAHLASDTAAEWYAWQHAVDYLAERNYKFDVFVSLPATSPLRSEEDVQGCLDLLTEGTDAVITVTAAARSPFFNMVVIDEAGFCSVVNSGEAISRRQDAPVVYDITTVAYVTTPKFIVSNDRLFAGQVKSWIVPKHRAVDIDDIYDFRVAEAFYSMQDE
ncbi:cytidylyltransferase domain-containing protein [Pseudomonas sp. H9]|uniref:acylneuraminate cytidylyltransferase family protein n=1 Tax=Pseudomonas sp. H9 TaxID=483968 RepID=UPI00105786BD|nr:acylneuraminate cytidylyltransferase family protein [Pseudomonas sp. H9]TDF81193.1 acylneuraminate cytidylyltransferase family protein [Pseudomonas sp. H9]